eukprot:scaffold6315_cov71-Cyclotella_meneghiniana.AAC.4
MAIKLNLSLPEPEGKNIVNVEVAGRDIIFKSDNNGILVLRSLMNQNRDSLISGEDNAARTAMMLCFVNELEIKGYKFMKVDADLEWETANDVEKLMAVRKEYQRMIYSPIENRIDLDEDIARLIEKLPKKIRDELAPEHDDHFPYAIHSTHTVSPRCMKLDSKGRGASIVPISELDDKFRWQLKHREIREISKENDHSYISNSIAKAARLTFAHHKYEREPFGYWYVHVVETKDRSIDNVGLGCECHQRMWKTKDKLPIVKSYCIQLGSNGNLSDEDSKMTIIRENKDMKTKVEKVVF